MLIYVVLGMIFLYDIHKFLSFYIGKNLILFKFAFHHNKRILVIKFQFMDLVKHKDNVKVIYIIFNLNELKYISYIKNKVV